MTATQSGTASDAQVLPYLINDADEHSTPATGAYEKYIDPDKKDMAIRMSPGGGDDRRQLLYNGRPARFTFKNFQVVGSNELLEDIGVKDSGSTDGGQVIPGSLLNRLNPLKDLDAEGRKEFAKKYRAMQEQLDNPADRLTVMDSQGIQCAVNFATLPGTEVEFEDDFDGLYANLTALNRYLGTEWGFNYENRLFTPPFISFADPDAALAQLEDIMKIETPKVIQTSSGPSMHTSPFRPENDRFWSICSEAGIKLATHLASVTRYAAQGEEWNEPEVMLGDMDAFQWVFYYGDRPAVRDRRRRDPAGLVRTVPEDAAAALGAGHGVGAVHHPQARPRVHDGAGAPRGASSRCARATTSSSTASWHRSPRRTSTASSTSIGIEPIVFGSDFPHGEGLPEPQAYLGQLKNFSDDQVKTVMRDNLARFLDLPS